MPSTTLPRYQRPLAGSRGDCFDNAAAESFFATIEKELVHRQTWPTRRERFRSHECGFSPPTPSAFCSSWLGPAT